MSSVHTCVPSQSMAVGSMPLGEKWSLQPQTLGSFAWRSVRNAVVMLILSARGSTVTSWPRTQHSGYVMNS